MVLDNERQRQLLLQLIAAASIPGSALDTIFQLRQEIAQATILPTISNLEGALESNQ